MRIAYGKFGRSLTLNRDKYGFQGDAEAPQLLERLARRNPDVEWVIVGRTTDGSINLPNVTNSWEKHREPFRRLMAPFHSPLLLEEKRAIARFIEDEILPTWAGIDGAVIHAGQHGTSNESIPQSHNTWEEYDRGVGHTNPQDWSVSYGGMITRGLRELGDRSDGRIPVIWIVTDPRNFLKARDIKWPTGCDDILAQYTYTKSARHERFRDPRPPTDLGFDCKTDRGGEIWVAQHRYHHCDLELMILPDDWEDWGEPDWSERQGVGIATTSFTRMLKAGELRRSQIVKEWVLDWQPHAEVYGKWDTGSLADVPEGTVRLNEPHEFQRLLARWKVTLALPALGSTWTTAKPYQCFAANVATFLVGPLDDQGWILPTRRKSAGTHLVGKGLWSIRDDWTDQELALANWLRVETKAEFRIRADVVLRDELTWAAIVKAQRDLLRRRWHEALLENTIEERLGLK